MTIAPDLSTAVAAAATRRNLHLRSDLAETGWTFWELPSLNLHRVVGFLREYRHFADTRDLEGEIRGAMSRNFRRSWWRGMAYGVAVEAGTMPFAATDLASLVDAHENSKGVLQWTILVANDKRTAIGAHTWIESYLSPVYRETLGALASAGFRVATAVKGKDGLMKFLTKISDWEGVHFPEFQDRT